MSANQSRFGCLGIFVVVLLILSLLFNAGFLFTGFRGMAAGDRRFNETVLVKPAGNVSTKIAVISLRGIISGYIGGSMGESMVEDIKLQLEQALEDDDVRAIVLAIDSPGGEVTASDIIYEAVRKADEKKPVVASMGAIAASGGYYVAMGARHVFAHDTTITGSIGVIMQTLNYSDLLGKVGLQMVTFKSGKFKDVLSGSRAITDEERDLMQTSLMQTYGRFVGIVARERSLPEDGLRNGLADGRPISGRDAAEAKLVDEIGDFEAAVAKAIQLGTAPGSAVVRYESQRGLGIALRLLGEAPRESRNIELKLALPGQLDLRPGYQYLIPASLAPQ